VFAWLWGLEGEVDMAIGHRVSFEIDESVLKLIVGMVNQLCEYTKKH
jgi:hypothetical protein